jgi:hypothetical protein
MKTYLRVCVCVCVRTESMSLEKGFRSCAEMQVFSCYRG